MSRSKSWHDVAIPCVLVKFGSFNVLSCQFGVFWLSFQSIWINLDDKYHLPLWLCYCNSSTSFHVQDGQNCFIDRWTSQFGNFWLCSFVKLCDVSLCQQVLPHWAGPMFWWMAKNLMTNDTYDCRAAGLRNSAVQITPPWSHMTRIISSNWTLRAYIHWSPPSIADDL